MDLDENGWVVGAITPFAVDDAWTLLSPEPEGRVDGPRWGYQAQTFFRARIELVQGKRYPSGAMPIADQLEVDIGGRGDAVLTRIVVLTMPIDRAPALYKAGMEGARAIGGAGFDALVARSRRVWQVGSQVPQPQGERGGDVRAPLVMAAILASVFLAPLLPPGGGTIFGVKGARERLGREGWRT